MGESENKSLGLDILVWVAILSLVAILTLIAIPNFFYVRDPCQRNSCINNLRQIDAASKQFALEHNLTNGASINFPNDLTPYVKLDRDGKNFPCPQGGIYHLSKIGETPTCSLGTTVNPAHVIP